MTEELIEFLQEQGYTDLCLKGEDICGIYQMCWTHAVLVNMDQFGYEYRACYHSYDEARSALGRFDGDINTLTEFVKIK